MSSTTKPKPFTIRPATTEDAAQLQTIERSATAKFLEIPALADLVETDSLSFAQAQKWAQSGTTWVAVEPLTSESHHDSNSPPQRDHILGFVATELKDGFVYIAEISVSLAQNGRGVGSVLLKTVFDYVRSRQKQIDATTKAKVTLTTYPDVPWNGPFYTKRGFKRVPPESLGPEHQAKMQRDGDERDLVRPGFPRCCMLWEDE